jgi:putative ABC transport system permease protein
MVESLLLAAIGGMAGAVATSLIFDGISASTLGSGFRRSWSRAVAADAVVSGVMGLLGGLVPALRAARVPLLAVHDH